MKNPNKAGKRNTLYIEYKGERKLLSKWCLELGLSYPMVRGRIRCGWEVSKALETPQTKFCKGQSKDLAYSSWDKMKSRCYNLNDPHYEYYGGRGIKICDRWKNSFENFLEDMGPRINKKYSIDRINNDGNYEPGNCRWATSTDQINNRRNTRYIIFNNNKITAKEISLSLGITCTSVINRIDMGWPLEDIITIKRREFRHDKKK